MDPSQPGYAAASYLDFINEDAASSLFADLLDPQTLNAVCTIEQTLPRPEEVASTRKRMAEHDSDSDEDETKDARNKRGKTDGPSSSTAARKASREKARREKINERFAELASLIDPGNEPKTDKPTILADAIKYIQQTRVENHQLKQLNKFLEERVSQYERERGQALYQQMLSGQMLQGFPASGMLGGSSLPSASMPGPSNAVHASSLPQAGPIMQQPVSAAAIAVAAAAAAAGPSSSSQVPSIQQQQTQGGGGMERAVSISGASHSASQGGMQQPQHVSMSGAPLPGQEQSNTLQQQQMQLGMQQQQQQQQQQQLPGIGSMPPPGTSMNHLSSSQLQTPSTPMQQGGSQHSAGQVVLPAHHSEIQVKSEGSGSMGGVMMMAARAPTPAPTPQPAASVTSNGSVGEQQQQQHHQQQQQQANGLTSLSSGNLGHVHVQQSSIQQQQAIPVHQGMQMQQPQQHQGMQSTSPTGFMQPVQGMQVHGIQNGMGHHMHNNMQHMHGMMGMQGPGGLHMNTPHLNGMGTIIQATNVMPIMHAVPSGMNPMMPSAGGKGLLMGVQQGGQMPQGSMQGMQPMMQSNVQPTATYWVPPTMLDSRHDSLLRPPAA